MAICNYQLIVTQLTHNVFKTLLDGCAEIVWDKRCSNIVATFDQIYFVWQWKWVISNVDTTLQQRYLATCNVAATLFGNICSTFAQSCHSTLWELYLIHSLWRPFILYIFFVPNLTWLLRKIWPSITFLHYVYTTFTQCCGNVATTLNY